MEQNSYELHFAPLQGYTDSFFRNAFDKHFGGIDVYYTPFIRVDKGSFMNRDLRGIEPDSNSVSSLIPQILPGSSEEFRVLTDMIVAKGYSKIDINLGCPFPMIAGKHKGAGMLPYPEQVATVLNTVNEYPEIRFSLKMRLGWESVSECIILCDILNNLRLEYITVHTRTGKQQYKGQTDPEAFARFQENCQHPLFYNGDLTTTQEIVEILRRFPMLRGVSIGRGLLASPLLAKEFKENETFSDETRMSLCSAFHNELFYVYSERLQGETQLLMKMKTLWEYFLPATDRKVLKKIKKANKIGQYKEAVSGMFNLTI